MGLEYKLETCDAVRLNIPEFLRRQPEFLSEEDGAFHLSIDGHAIAVTVQHVDKHVLVIQHTSCRQTDALLGLLIRRILTFHDQVVVSEYS
jgi:hypothetical protein